VPTISCRQLARTPPPPGERAVVCYDDLFKLLLERSALGGKQVAATTTGRDSETGLDEVRLRLTSAGQEKWSAVSTEAANAVDCRPVGDNHCQLAFLLDGKVLSTPEILRPLAADEARITLGSAAEARMIAATLGPRELPSGVKLDR
jgi:preprotein translocase subunit SecD